MDSKLIDHAIHKVKNFPKPGILFYDITGILNTPHVFKAIVDYYVERYKDTPPQMIAAIDSRGFIFASPVAYVLQVPLLLVRKYGKLPRETVSQEFELEYGKDRVEVHREDVPKGNVVVFDDLLATGGTAHAACTLLESQGACIQEIASIIALNFLPFAEALKQYPLHYLVSYDNETC